MQTMKNIYREHKLYRAFLYERFKLDESTYQDLRKAEPIVEKKPGLIFNEVAVLGLCM